MKRKVWLLLVVSVLLIFLASCGNELREGVICDKQYTPAHTSIMTQYVPLGGKQPNFILVPLTVYHDEEWTVTIADEAGESRATYSVSQAIYEQYEIGDWFSIDDHGREP